MPANFSKLTDILIRTSGTGLWSTRETKVRIVKLEFDNEFDKLDAYFSPESWNTAKDGLIYSDPRFLVDLASYLFTYFPGTDWSRLEYTEQGMQGREYVSLELI